MSDKCAYPKCGKELIHVVGRRKKKYCNQKCNSAHWQKKNYVPSDKKPKFKRVPIEQYNTMKTKLSEIELMDIDKAKELLGKYGSDTIRQAENKMAEFGSKVKDLNKATGEVKPPEQPTTNYTVNTKAKEGDPKEGTMSFFNKFGCMYYSEIKK